jgi:hypothetical protein
MPTTKDGFHIQSGNRELVPGVFVSLLTGMLFATTKALLRALPADFRFEGLQAHVLEDASNWVFDADGTEVDATHNLIMSPSAGSGRWMRTDSSCVLKIPFSFANTDDEVIFTVPAGFAFRLTAYPFLDIETAFTGGTDASFGISTNITGYTADGALVGVSLLAAATAGVKPCTIGAELPDLAHLHALLFIEDSAIEYNRVVSAFTAGAADLCLPVAIARV